MYRVEAAVGLLIGHASWLRRRDFLAVAVEFAESSEHRPATAAVDWRATVAGLDAGRLPCSSGEEQVLRLAASLAAGVPVDLGSTLTGLDEHNVALVAAAVAHAGGSPSRDDAGTKSCPVCGKRFLPVGRQRHCSGRCRKTAFRRRHQDPVPVAIPEVCPRRPHTVYECGCGARALGEQRCGECGTFGRAVGVGGLCPACDEPVAVTELVHP